jgi:hypothetical protein
LAVDIDSQLASSTVDLDDTLSGMVTQTTTHFFRHLRAIFDPRN